ncbi:c-type cytochrome [Synechococcus sp. O70.2]|jgi:cytochrome c6
MTSLLQIVERKMRIVKLFLLLLLVGAAVFWSPQVASAEPDLALGAKVFQAKCVGCHLNGRNSIVPAKNLSLAALHEYHVDTLELIQAQVRNGKGAMPAFGKLLKPEEIEAVAAYVLDRAEHNWSKG